MVVRLHEPAARWVALKILFLCVVVALVAPCFGRAQPIQGPCIPDCPTIPFTATETVVLQIPPTCFVRVHYAHRSTCGNYYDVAILMVEVLSDDCNAMSMEQIMQGATGALMLANPMGFPVPVPGTCLESWRLVRGGCWRDDETNCLGDRQLKPCPGDACCVTKVKMCFGTQGQISVEGVGGFLQRACVPVPTTCRDVCDIEYVDYLDMFWNYRGAAVEAQPSTTGSVVVRATGHALDGLASATVAVVGMDGHQRRTVSAAVVRGTLEQSVDIGDLPDGLYRIVVLDGSRPLGRVTIAHRR